MSITLHVPLPSPSMAERGHCLDNESAMDQVVGSIGDMFRRWRGLEREWCVGSGETRMIGRWPGGCAGFKFQE